MKPIAYIALLILFSSLYAEPVIAQNKPYLSFGAGVPELLNLGIGYHFDRVQLGLGAGTFPVKDETIISVRGDLRFYFGKYAEISNRRKWYVKLGLDYLRDETDRIIDKYLYLNTRAGRDFSISENLAIVLDLGALLELNHVEIEKEPPSGFFNIDIEPPVVLPSLGLGLVYYLPHKRGG